MQTRYQVVLYDTNGVRQAVFDDWISLNVDKIVNGIHTHQLSMSEDDPRVSLFTLDSLVEVKRSVLDEGLDWYREYIGLHRTTQFNTTVTGKGIFTSYGRGLCDLLARRYILYPAGDPTYSTKNAPGETTMKEFVEENAGPSATAPPRLYNGVTSGLSIQVTAGQGAIWEGDRAYKNLLDILKEVALATGVDFDVVYLGNATFEFRAYYPQLGTSKIQGSTNPVIFSTLHGDMLKPYYTISRTEEVTSIVVLGQGQEANRMNFQLSSADTADSPWNTIELVRDARQESTIVGLQSIATAELEKLQAQEKFTFDVLQIPSSIYGLHYVLGDVITARYRSVSRNKKIIGVSLTCNESGESIRVEFGDVP